MSQLSQTDQQIWKKVLNSKNKVMNQLQIEQSFPALNRKAVMSSLNALLKISLLSSEKAKDDDKTLLFHAHQPGEARQKAALTAEQSLVLKVISAAGNRGIASSQIHRQIGSDIMPQAILRKTVRALESNGHIKQFKPVNAPTTVYYLLSHLKPPEEISGGIWFDDNKEYDQGLVDAICQVLLARVRDLTYVTQSKRTDKDRDLVLNAINTSSKPHSSLTPHALRAYVNKLGISSASLSIKNVMEIMRALELDGLVEVVKPLGGVEINDDLIDERGSDDDGPSSSKRKKSNGTSYPGIDDNDDLDEDEKERRRQLVKDKEKEKIKEKKRREKVRQREKEKEKERKAKEKKKKKKEKEKKEKEKEKKKRDKEKRKKKRKDDSETESGSDSDTLRDINDLSGKKKKKKRRRSTPLSSSSASSSASSSSSDSDSDSDDSGSDSDSSVSSVASSQIDTSAVALKPSRMANSSIMPSVFVGGTGGGLTDLSDTLIIYKATNRLGVPLGQTQAPCGKCPVFAFCQEGGPVEPEGCKYYTDWLGDNVGGWDAEALKTMRPELNPPPAPAEGVDGVIEPVHDAQEYDELNEEGEEGMADMDWK